MHKIEAQSEHSQQIDNEHHPVEPPEAGIIIYAHLGSLSRAHTGLILAVNHQPAVLAVTGIVHHGTAGAGQGRVTLHLAPGVGDSIIY